MNAQTPDEVAQAAESAFTSGLYCAESVVLAIAKSRGIDSVELTRMATGFCAGMARSRGPCGALTGGVMGLGLALGRSSAGESPDHAYEATRRLIAEFEQAFGSRDCHVLLGCDLGTPEGQAAFREKGLRAQCTRYTAKAAGIAATILAEHAG